MKLKLDLHVHTTNSPDAFTKADQLVGLCKKAGIDGLAITDHNKVAQGFLEGICVIPGIEVSTKNGHVIGLGVSRSITRGMTASDTIREIQMGGGVAVIPHPYDLLRSSVDLQKLSVRPDAIEVVNSSSVLHSIAWKRARIFAAKSGLPSVGGSDSHIPQTVGSAFTVVETSSTDPRSVLDAITKGAVAPEGRPIKFHHRVRKLVLRATRTR